MSSSESKKKKFFFHEHLSKASLYCGVSKCHKNKKQVTETKHCIKNGKRSTNTAICSKKFL